MHATNCAILAIDEEDLDVQRIENLDTKLALCGHATHPRAKAGKNMPIFLTRSKR